MISTERYLPMETHEGGAAGIPVVETIVLIRISQPMRYIARPFSILL